MIVFILYALIIAVFIVVYLKNPKKRTIIIERKIEPLTTEDWLTFTKKVTKNMLKTFILNNICKIKNGDIFRFVCKNNIYRFIIDQNTIYECLYNLNVILYKNNDFGQMDIELYRDGKLLYKKEIMHVTQIQLFISKNSQFLSNNTYPFWTQEGVQNPNDRLFYYISSFKTFTPPKDILPMFCLINNQNGEDTFVYDF